jgi:glutathione peroxidase
MSMYSHKINPLTGSGDVLGAQQGKVTLLVNVASKCGLTPQYTAMQQLQTDLAAKGFSVIGVPCNQFMGQEPGSADEIVEFCSTTYGVSFPMTEKIEVNGEARHGLFVLDREGNVVARFQPQVAPDAPEVLAAIHSALG